MNARYVNLASINPELGISCNESCNPEQLLLCPHIHDELEMVYLITGNLRINIADEEFPVSSGDVIILNRLAPHEFIVSDADQPLEYIIVHFKPTHIYDNKKINIKFLEPFYHTSKFVYYLGNKERDALDDVVELMYSLMRHANSSEFASELLVHSEMIRLLYLLHSNQIFSCTSDDIQKRAKHVRRIAKLQKYIDSHYSEDISAEFACEFVQLDYHYFSRLFKQETGLTFIAYLNTIRLLKAEILLSTTNYPIAYIAENVGIANVAYFNRIFKKHFNTTPSAYRKLHTQS